MSEGEARRDERGHERERVQGQRPLEAEAEEQQGREGWPYDGRQTRRPLPQSAGAVIGEIVHSWFLRPSTRLPDAWERRLS